MSSRLAKATWDPVSNRRKKKKKAEMTVVVVEVAQSVAEDLLNIHKVLGCL